MLGVGTMVQALNFLAVLRMISEAQQSCNHGLGRIVYEKVPNYQLQGFDDDIIKDNREPFQALEKCQDLCIRDRTASNNLIRACNSIDFQPGRLLNDMPIVQYEESQCTLSREQSRPEGLGALVVQPGYFHFAEVCLTASRIEANCPKRKFIFERVPKKRFRSPDFKEIPVTNRTECEDRCLNELSFTCRSATYDSSTRTCYLSQDTRRTHPSSLSDDPGFEYLENTCLSPEERCEGTPMFLKELKPSLTGPLDIESLQDVSLEECQQQCLNAERYFCRSIVYNPTTKFCVLSGEDSFTIMDRDITGSPQVGGAYPYYELMCMDSIEGARFISPRSGTKQSRQGEEGPKKRDVLTAFQRYRNSRLNLDYQTEITERTLAECLDECLRQTSYRCKSAMYSEKFRICRLSRFDQKDGRLSFDQDYDYYESLTEFNPLVPVVNKTDDRSLTTPKEFIGASRPSNSPGQNPYDDQYPGGTGSSSNPFPPFGNGKPFQSSVCGDKDDGYRQIGSRLRIRRPYIKRYFQASSLFQCERECSEARDFGCRSFNYNRLSYGNPGVDRDNCELSDRDSIDLDVGNPAYFETSSDFDFYERVGNYGKEDCLEVSQTCSEDGMEFTLRTQEGFTGRIYTHGYYDRCFFRGNGGTTSSLRISGPRGYPDCGTQKYSDILTNIVVVQFSELVQTSKDKRYNLTCMLAGPGEAVVTSGYIGSSSGSPVPIEYLPAQNILDSRVRLAVLYQGRPTTTIAVGDPLTFRLETQQGYNLLTDIFATNIIAKDPYSGRSVQLIDRFGCPVDDVIFPSLDRARSGDGLEARFNAFKIPESNFLVFEATVKSCRGGCQPVYCSSNGGRASATSYGRRRREAVLAKGQFTSLNFNRAMEEEEEDIVMEMLRVYTNRDDIPLLPAALIQQLEVCLTSSEYNGIIATMIILVILLLLAALFSGILFRRYRNLKGKNSLANGSAPSVFGLPASGFFCGTFSRKRRPSTRNFSMFLSRFATSYDPKHSNETSTDQHTDEPIRNPIFGKSFDDPSEPVYTDPSLFERNRSFRSCTTNVNRISKNKITGETNNSADFSEL
ncbi:uncharacterized protein LOC136035551 isoform X2 [Artemia franciscana]|uniref:uncharacterized protein LOC136035551 isoform X2 n=1 Tax=Artemia franciscana TaxID=6661 RepID=UPI0032DB1340